MKIVALWGKSNVGKTTTIKKLLVKVLDKYGNDCLRDPSHHISRQSLTEELQRERFAKPLNSRSPIRNVYTKVEIDGCLIGITTAGDSKETLEEAFKTFGDCELCFCATHVRGDTVEYVKQLAENDMLIWYGQCEVSSNGNYDLKERFQTVSDKVSDILFEELQLQLS